MSIQRKSQMLHFWGKLKMYTNKTICPFYAKVQETGILTNKKTQFLVLYYKNRLHYLVEILNSENSETMLANIKNLE